MVWIAMRQQRAARTLVKYKSNFQHDSVANDFPAVDHDLLFLKPRGLDVLQRLACTFNAMPYGIVKTFWGFGAYFDNFCNTHIPCSVLILFGFHPFAEYTDAIGRLAAA
jgi:hypothetical protein